MPKNTAPKNKEPVKILRSRTATAQMRNQLFHQNFDYLREITERREVPSTSTGRGRRGRPRGRGGLIGGGALSGEAASETPTPSTGTRNVATTTEPRRADFSQQLRSCSSCNGLDHQDNLCQADAPPSRPLAVTCNQCSHSYAYKEENGTEVLVTTTATCSAHRRRIVGASRLALEKKKKAEFLLSKIDELIGLGSSLQESLQWLGVSESRYQKLRSRVEL